MVSEAHTRIRLHNLEVTLQPEAQAADALRRAVARRLRLGPEMLGTVTAVRRALDARQRQPRYNYVVDVDAPAPVATRLLQRGHAALPKAVARQRFVLDRAPDGARPVVVGAGPAGFLAALTLAEAGWAPILIERGRPVEPRARDVSKLYSQGVLDPESNVCFGEGGAGTFSDGKLYTRVGDGRVDAVMHHLVAHGAPAHIHIDNRPHLGTDRLVALLKSIRARLLALGATLRFDTRVDDFVFADGAIKALVLQGGEVLDAPHVVLATGHSARHVWERLHAHGLPLECRPFAVGFRVEHPQAMIDEARYGKAACHSALLPAADYRLTYNEPGDVPRGVYSFCMCPGGVVVTTPTTPEQLCINGMSHASRRGRYANSALVVSVTPEDFAAAGHTGVFAGVDFQEAAERAAYEAGGGAFVAPACRVDDFVAGRVSASLGATSYRRGLWAADLSTLYPAAITGALRRALPSFARKIRGFVSNEAQLMGVETRTASPVRLPRGVDLQAVGAAGLYPAGEGLGYGGGIVSAAVDGMRAAEALLERIGARAEAVV